MHSGLRADLNSHKRCPIEFTERCVRHLENQGKPGMVTGCTLLTAIIFPNHKLDF